MPMQAQRGDEGVTPTHLQPGTVRWVVVTTRSGRLTPANSRYPLYRRLGGPQGLSGQHGKSHPTGTRSPDRQAAASPYTDYATPVALKIQYSFK